MYSEFTYIFRSQDNEIKVFHDHASPLRKPFDMFYYLIIMFVNVSLYRIKIHRDIQTCLIPFCFMPYSQHHIYPAFASFPKRSLGLSLRLQNITSLLSSILCKISFDLSFAPLQQKSVAAFFFVYFFLYLLNFS